VTGRFAFVEAVRPDGTVCASAPGAVVHAKALVLSGIVIPTGCAKPDFQVLLPVGGNATALDVVYRASLVASDPNLGLGVLRIDCDAAGRSMPAPSLAHGDVASGPIPGQVAVHAVAVGGSGVSSLAAAPTPVLGNQLATAIGASAAGAIVVDTAGRIAGFVNAASSRQVLWAQSSAALISAAAAAA
jgi:hypothetical protein